MRVFIVGNGFDLGHGLQTRYWDFRVFLKTCHPKFLNDFEEHYYIYGGTGDEVKKKYLWNELESNLANIDEDIIIEQALDVDLDLESGDIGIEDTMYSYFTEEYQYIECLVQYLREWIRTIRIRDIKPKTSLINNADDALYISFNYTALLETAYKISDNKITHIHGSLRKRDGELVLGHGNNERIREIRKKRNAADNVFDEKESSICQVIEDYYRRTFKDIHRYIPKLGELSHQQVDEIIVIGHSVSGVDVPYFQYIDEVTKKAATWTAYYYCQIEKEQIYQRLVDCGIEQQRLLLLPSADFYNC